MTIDTCRHVEMTGSDKRMDRQGENDHPVNVIPVKCQRCTFPDLDFVPQPYFLAKGTKDPNEMAPAELGNFLVRERARRVFETVAPSECRYYATYDLKTKEATPWFLAVPNALVRTATVKQSVPRCPECGEPKVSHPGEHYEYPSGLPLGERAAAMANSAATLIGSVAEEIFKSLNWSSAETTLEESWYYRHIIKKNKKHEVPPYLWTREFLGRDLYFSVRLQTLLKALGIKGLLPAYPWDQKPTSEELAWVDDKRRLLLQQGLVEPLPNKEAAKIERWFQKYLKKNAGQRPSRYDWNAIESKSGIPLPPAYKAFISTIGKMTFQHVDEEGFTIHILSADQLDYQTFRKGHHEMEDEESRMVDGLMFAGTDHGDCLCFDLTTNAPDYPVYIYDHEKGIYEAYAKDFTHCLQRLAGE